MMIGKGNETSASFVNYQLQRQSGQDDNDASNVNDAVRRKMIGELARDASDESGKNVFDTDAYQVDISDRAKNWLTFATGSTAQISLSVDFGAGWTREDELAVLEKSIGQYQRMNENYRRTGSPVDPLEEQKRLERITSQFPAGDVAASATAAENGMVLAQQDFSDMLKTSANFVDGTVPVPTYTPVTEIRSQHYRWTEAAGIEETVSKAEELASARTALRQDLENTVTESIDAILTPYDTYEEAYDALYGRQGVAAWSSLDEDSMSRVERLKPVQGAFGALANHLNNYLEEFGAEDSFFTTLDSALDGLIAKHGENDLVNQIRRMVAASRSGQILDTGSKQFERDVTAAIVETYGGVEAQTEAPKEKKTNKTSDVQEQGLTFLEMQRRAAEEEGQLLDELLGKEHERGFESAGDVLKKRQPEEKDAEFTDRLRRVDEKVEARQPFAFATEEKKSGTAQPKAGIERLTAIHDEWLSVSEQLMEGFEAEKQGYFNHAVASADAVQ